MGKAWHDLALFKYKDASSKEEKELPAQMRGFVDLRNIPANHTSKYGPGIYAILETVRSNRHPRETAHPSELFVPYRKDLKTVSYTHLTLPTIYSV